MNAPAKTIAISGGFDPLHIGHVRMMQEARALGAVALDLLPVVRYYTGIKPTVFSAQAVTAVFF